VVCGTTGVHFDEEIYNQPQQFQPHRFMNHSLEKSTIRLDDLSAQDVAPITSTKNKVFTKNGVPIRHNLLPFGGGASLCPGRTFATNEIITFTAAILMYLDIQSKDNMPGPNTNRGNLGVIPPGSPYMVEMTLKPEFTV